MRTHLGKTATAFFVLVLMAVTLPLQAQSTHASLFSTKPTSSLENIAFQLSPSSTSPSPEAQRALAFISQREGIPIQQLRVVNEFQRDQPLIQRAFQAVTVMDQANGRFFEMLVDRSSGQVNERTAIV